MYIKRIEKEERPILEDLFENWTEYFDCESGKRLGAWFACGKQQDGTVIIGKAEWVGDEESKKKKSIEKRNTCNLEKKRKQNF